MGNRKLEVIAFKDGAVIRVSKKNPTWGSIMTMESSWSLNNGLLNNNKRIGFMRAPLVSLEQLTTKAGDDMNAKLIALGIHAKKTIIVESLVATYPGQQPKINPTTKAPILHKGQPVYYNTDLVDDVPTNVDIRLKADTTTVVVTVEGTEAMSE